MDAFFASVEQRDRPELQGRPVLVGGSARRGVVAAASYEARTFGVHSAMPMAKALRLCPHAVVVPGRRTRYVEASRCIFDIFRRYTPLVEGLSIDEAFLDVSGSLQLFGDGRTIAQRIREEIEAETDLTASAGVAPNKFVAKIASDVNKPNGLTVIAPDEVKDFLAPLPIRKMWGVGPKAAERLHALGFATFADLQSASEALLVRELGSWGEAVSRLSRGEDARAVVSDRDTKSVSVEQTFEHDLCDDASLRRVLLEQSDRLASRLLRAGLHARTVTVKVKFPDFRTKTRQLATTEPIADATSIYEIACRLLVRFAGREQGVRLLGVGVSNFGEGSYQRSLFEDQAEGDAPRNLEKRSAVQTAVESLRSRFGADVVVRGTLHENANGGGDQKRTPSRG